MTGKVSRVYKKIPLSSLGIFKITDYPFEERDFKPFALARLCVLDDEVLVARVWSFEVNPKAEVKEPCEDIFNDSTLSFAVGNREKFLLFTVNNAGVVYTERVANGKREKVGGSDVHNHFFTGEDLQGIYWGAQLSIPLDLIKEYTDTDVKNGEFEGNLYKSCFSEREHFGGFFPIRSDTPDLYCTDSFGTFEITEY